MHLAILRFPVREVLRDQRGAVLGRDCKNGKFVVTVRSTIIGRALDFGAVVTVAAFHRVPVMTARGRNPELKGGSDDE